MAYSITCSTKILTSAIAPFLLVGVLREFAMVPGVHILLSLKEDEMHFSSWRHRLQHIHQKELNLGLSLYYYAERLLLN